MPLLSRLLERLNSAGGTNPPKDATPDAPGGSFITIDASQHIVQAVTVFRNNTAQVLRTFHDLKLKVRPSSTEGRQANAELGVFWPPGRRKHRRD